MSLKRAVIFSSIERYYGFVIAFVTTIVISRLLTPAEVGAFSIAMSLAGVAGGLREFGASSFLIRTAQLEKRHESCAFGLTLLLGGSLGGLLLVLAGPLAGFFGQANVGELLRILSINFFLLPFGTVNNALIQRAMKFNLIAGINMIATTLGFIVSVALAWNGQGPFSLAWGAVALTSSSAILSIRWGPGPAIVQPRLRGAGELVRFGAQTTGLSVLWEISARFPDFILGKMHSFAAAGLMARAIGLAGNVNDLLLKGLNPVALSYFSQIQRENGDPVRAHIRIATLVTGLGWPAFAGLAFFAEPLTLALYGEQWLGIVWPLRIVCIQLCLALPFSFQYQVVVAKNVIQQQVKASVITIGLKLIILAFAATEGAVGVAIGLVVGQLIGTLLCIRFVWPAIGVCEADYWQVIRANLPIMILTLIACSMAVAACEHWQIHYVPTILGIGPIVALILLAGYLALRHPLIEEVRKLLKDRGHIRQ